MKQPLPTGSEASSAGRGKPLDPRRVRELSIRCARGELRDPAWEKIDASDWHGEAASEQGLDYGAAGAHIAYWFAWMVEHDLYSGFVCTDSDALIDGYVEAITRFKNGDPGALEAIRGQAEELHGSMLSVTGNGFTRAHYENYLNDYTATLGGRYAPFSEENYTLVRSMLEKKYGPLLPRP